MSWAGEAAGLRGAGLAVNGSQLSKRLATATYRAAQPPRFEIFIRTHILWARPKNPMRRSADPLWRQYLMRRTDNKSPVHSDPQDLGCTCGPGRAASTRYACITCLRWNRLLSRMESNIEARRSHAAAHSTRSSLTMAKDLE